MLQDCFYAEVNMGFWNLIIRFLKMSLARLWVRTLFNKVLFEF
jgi:hypothetical protein